VKSVVTKTLRKERKERYNADAMMKHLERIDRFTELSQSLELYGLDPGTKLKSPRAQIDPLERTFELSNYRVLMDTIKKRHMEKEKMSSWLILRAVEELIKIHAPESWAKSFVTELVQSKKHKGGDIGKIAQYLWTSAKRHDGSELCSILNRAIREDDPNAIIHAAVFANAINMLLVDDGTPQPWLQQIFHKTFPYPQLLGAGLQRLYLHFKEDLPRSARYCCTWRGGGFRDVFKEFFKRGKSYRVPGFLATSLEVREAMGFIHRSTTEHPRILWCIMLDGRGRTESEFRCKHAKFVLKTEVEGEMEFLFAPYSVFTVIRTDFSPQDWSSRSARYTVCIEASIDNDSSEKNLGLAPWS